MPTTNPRITFTVSKETMKAIDDYKFSHRMKNQTQAILSLIDIGFKETARNTLVTNSNPVTSTIKKALKTQRFRAFFFAIDT